jgi:hypothetical protein
MGLGAYGDGTIGSGRDSETKAKRTGSFRYVCTLHSLQVNNLTLINLKGMPVVVLHVSLSSLSDGYLFGHASNALA